MVSQEFLLSIYCKAPNSTTTYSYMILIFYLCDPRSWRSLMEMKLMTRIWYGRIKLKRKILAGNIIVIFENIVLQSIECWSQTKVVNWTQYNVYWIFLQVHLLKEMKIILSSSDPYRSNFIMSSYLLLLFLVHVHVFKRYSKQHYHLLNYFGQNKHYLPPIPNFSTFYLVKMYFRIYAWRLKTSWFVFNFLYRKMPISFLLSQENNKSFHL